VEVHHHPNVEKKNFKEYLLEFIMIFLAVSMGFFAESIREHITDSSKETQYAKSMIADLKNDTGMLREVIDVNMKRISGIDSFRKVLGARITNIFELLSKDFIKLLVLSICIASPIAWWAMNKWLQDFAYRIGISWWIFASVGAICLLIALVTISFQAIKAAVANPVNSLRSE
jgi:uncharacterized membrane protein YraQ (UPF0718 family)